MANNDPTRCCYHLLKYHYVRSHHPPSLVGDRMRHADAIISGGEDTADIDSAMTKALELSEAVAA